MTENEFYHFVITEAKEGKTDKEILNKLLKVEGYEDAIQEIEEIRTMLSKQD